MAAKQTKDESRAALTAAIIGDIPEDGALNNFDIDPFVMLLAGEYNVWQMIGDE